MRSEGRLTQWQDDRGFGFITLNRGGEKLFVHISAFPRDGNRPSLGERLNFEVETDPKGRKRAIRLQCPDRPISADPHYRTRKSGRFLPLLVLILVGLALYTYREYSSLDSYANSPPASSTMPIPSAISVQPTTSAQAATSVQSAEPVQSIALTHSTKPASISALYHCDGRTRCTQMTSCEEARFFLQQCPGVLMDGNGDGNPCEEQWCH